VCSNLLREIVELSIVFIKYWKFILYYWNWNRLENSKVLCCVFLLVWHKCLLSVPFNGKRVKKLIANHQKLVTGRILAEWGPSKIRPYDHFPFCINVIVCVKSDFPKVFFFAFQVSDIFWSIWPWTVSTQTQFSEFQIFFNFGFWVDLTNREQKHLGKWTVWILN